MPSEDIVLAAYYEHDRTGERMRMVAASAPELDDMVRMIEPGMFPARDVKGGFARTWTDSWDTFKREWTRIEEK